MAEIIKKDGTRVFIEPKNGTDFQYEELKAIVGGFVEIVRLPDKSTIMIVNEEGALADNNQNVEATKYYRDAWGVDYPHYQHDVNISRLQNDNPNVTVIDLGRSGAYEPYTICGDILICAASQVH